MPKIPIDTLPALRAGLDRESRRLHVMHADRMHCGRGCSGCCVDGLTVFEIEATPIRRIHAELLRVGEPHREGACAFLDDEGGCRIYEERPYVCRTQGLPLRWIDDGDESTPVELRDICPLNEAGDAVETLPADACFTLGPFEERLARLQVASGPAPRTTLRDLFTRK